MSTNPWISIWTNPRKTIREIVDTKPGKGFYLISILYGFQFVLNFASMKMMGANYSAPAILIGSLILSLIVGVIIFYMMSFSMYWIGKIFKGGAMFSHIRATVAWSNLPFTINGIVWIILAIITGAAAFSGTVGGGLLYFASIVNFAMAIWYVVLQIQTLREVQGFSLGQAIGNFILGLFVYFILLYILMFLIVPLIGG